METLFISRDAQLKRRENTLAVTVGGKTKPFPIEKIRHIVLLGESRLNTKLLTLCGQNGVRLSVFDYYGYFKGAFEPIEQNASGRVKLEQAQFILDNQQRMPVAREIVRGAAHNMRANLAYYQYRGNKTLSKPIQDITQLMERLHFATDSNELMGFEGQITQTYFAAWQQIDERLDFLPRVRRPPNNPINCLISFLNQLTYTVTRHETFKTHLEETFSFLHSPSAGRSSLSLDLSEPFKPILSHLLIFRMVKKKSLEDCWFDQKEGVCLLTETGRRNVVEQFSIRLEEQYQGHTYREWLYREALNIERHLLGVASYESFKKKL
jgi:CRISPR-associated protein Cas1